ncbi:MAG: hypothetical protein HYX97_06915 [Chloroflexi bacterium]|nr:hypothetical protein [Chloroflexota bacterium]
MKRKLISFDIDGTMSFGSPPGVIVVELALMERTQGNLIGSASDRTVSDQQRLWAAHGVTPDFTILKHTMAQLKQQFSASAYWHIGDGDMDQLFAVKAGFRFFLPKDYLHTRDLVDDSPT